jgi:hypothetical protein
MPPSSFADATFYFYWHHESAVGRSIKQLLPLTTACRLVDEKVSIPKTAFTYTTHAI